MAPDNARDFYFRDGHERARKALAALTDLCDQFPHYKGNRHVARLIHDLPYIIEYDPGRISLQQVAQKFGCTKQNVSIILRRNGITRETGPTTNKAYPHICAMLDSSGLEPAKAVEILRNAKRGNRRALNWVRIICRGLKSAPIAGDKP